MYVTICGRFCPDEGVVAGYDNRIRDVYKRQEQEMARYEKAKAEGIKQLQGLYDLSLIHI